MELQNIPGIGEKTINNLNKLNIFTTRDLIEYYPYKYNFYNPENINNATPNVTLTINGIVESIPKVIYIKRNFNYLTFRVITSNKLLLSCRYLPLVSDIASNNFSNSPISLMLSSW